MGSRWNMDVEEVARPAPLPEPYPSQPPRHSSPVHKSTNYNRIGQSHESTMKNPDQLKYLMRAGHYQRTSPSPSLVAPPMAISPASRDDSEYTQVSARAHAPALNSTAQLQRKAQALAQEVFEEDAEVRAEVERRAKDVVKPSTKNLLDFAPNEQRYLNLIPIDAPTPEPVHARRSTVKPSPSSTRHTAPSITGECFERNIVSPRFGIVTRSVYVQPMTTPACDATPHASLREYMREHPDI